MRREMALVRRAIPALRAEDVLRAATVDAARALGLSGEVGALVPGAYADLVELDVSASRERVLDVVTSEAPAVRRAWVGGRLARSEGGVGCGDPRSDGMV
jgi:cytosine/adenosine deaminase-related metal-dependent hydrolase